MVGAFLIPMIDLWLNKQAKEEEEWAEVALSLTEDDQEVEVEVPQQEVVMSATTVTKKDILPENAEKKELKEVALEAQTRELQMVDALSAMKKVTRKLTAPRGEKAIISLEEEVDTTIMTEEDLALPFLEVQREDPEVIQVLQEDLNIQEIKKGKLNKNSIF